jgi:hypothetical protein
MTTLVGLVAAGAGCGFIPSALQVIRRPGASQSHQRHPFIRRHLLGVMALSLPLQNKF